jgi:hypothetical protein
MTYETMIVILKRCAESGNETAALLATEINTLTVEEQNAIAERLKDDLIAIVAEMYYEQTGENVKEHIT